MNGTAVKTQQIKQSTAPRATLAGHVEIARIDHWFKNVFVLPGVIAALTMVPVHPSREVFVHVIIGLIATCLIASSNYVINEVMDAPFDRFHPIKHARPVPSGRVNIPLAYVQWIALMILGLAIASRVSIPLTVVLAVLWVMGCIYNIRPLRSKDVPYMDVLSEAVNNPLRLLAGWFAVTSNGIPPASLAMSYWMIGCYFMALKRFAECRHIGLTDRVEAYRPSLAKVGEQGLLVSVMFYGSSAMLFFGVFIMRYRLELILCVPLIAAVMASYFSLSFKENSAVQYPERLYREGRLMIAVLTCSALMTLFLFVDAPILYKVFSPTAPTNLPEQIRYLRSK